MSSFYWYDLETFGISPQFDRIAQFAGIRTDLQLNPVGTPDMFYCQPTLDTFADPEACLITGITPQDCQKKGLLETQFMGKINDIFSESHTCVVGYNSMRFDDEFIRYGNYRNLIDPYMREWARGNSRWDIIDMLRACYALRPEGINWAYREPGEPSFKLTDLTKANNLTHEAAHDALSDVQATIDVARLIKQKQPKLFEFCLQLRNKNYVKTLLNWQLQKPIVHVSNKIPAKRGCLAIMLPLAMHPSNANGIICYDLSSDPHDLFNLDVEEIRDRIFTPTQDLPEDCPRIPLKTIHLNKSPFISPLSVLKGVDLARINLDYEQVKQNLQLFKTQDSSALIVKTQAVFSQKFDNDNDDVDTLLYAGFFSSKEKSLFNEIRKLPAQKIKSDYFNYNFQDNRAKQLIFNYCARNFPEILSAKETQQWHKNISSRLNYRFGENAHSWFEKLNLLKSSDLTDSQKQMLNQLEKSMQQQLHTINS